ncbi:MAG TPA: NAD(P)H-binding protein [Anaeromyxobacteraceae bacterium]|nr:NAD(P)H-binding protein [Anaeromyxobacteraceae bacterium]
MPEPPPAQRRVLVTGGTGNLGSHVVAALEERGAIARVLSRRARPQNAPEQREWAEADLLLGELEPALRDVDAVVHLASEKGAGDADVVGTRRLLAAIERAGTRHLVVVSIIGCDRIPLPFYETKQRIEQEVRAGRAPWSLVRVAQFHSFVERLVATAGTLPVPAPIVSDLRFQPVDEREVADALVEIALGPPLGEAPEIAGPELLTLGEIAATWVSVTGRTATMAPVSVATLLGEPGGVLQPAHWVGPVLEGYRAAWNTPHAARTLGRISFADWLRRRQR